MKLLGAFLTLACGTLPVLHAFPWKIDELGDDSSGAAPMADLNNTKGGIWSNFWNQQSEEEHPQHLRRSLQQTAEVETVSDPSVYPKYNPLKDAKCFNDIYNVPEMTEDVRRSLYGDFVRIFSWGLANPKDGDFFAESTEVSSNRFPGMCIRMAFHDNTVDPGAYSGSSQEYVRQNIDANGWWTGPLVLESSGGDASLLLCPRERLHPNNNYDQTASRVLRVLQSSDPWPRGPGITDANGSRVNIMQKYKMSYADALHNCGLAALTFITEKDSSVPEFPSKTNIKESRAVYDMGFGRMDACIVAKDPRHLTSSYEYGSRVPLCGKSELLPGVNWSQTMVNSWFVNRGMMPGAWVSLFGTHTMLDNFRMPSLLRNVGVNDFDYFKDYTGCPVMKVTAAIEDGDEESSGCEWYPVCGSKRVSSSSGYSGYGTSSGYSTSDGVIKEKYWPMVRSDCAAGQFYDGAGTMKHQLNDVTRDMYDQMEYYTNNPGSWVSDITCAFIHLGGGDDVDCVGPEAVNPTPSNSLFGSVYAQRPYPGAATGTLSVYRPKGGESRFVGYNAKSISVGSDGTLSSVDTHDRAWISNPANDWEGSASDTRDFAVVGDNRYYQCSESNSRLSIWNGNSWTPIGNSCQRLSASSDGHVAYIATDGKVVYKTQYTAVANLQVSNIVGAKDIALYGGGGLYYIGSDNAIYRRTSYNGPSARVGENGFRISASSDGTVVMVSTDGSVWQKARNDNTNEWIQVPQQGLRVDDIAVMDQKNLFLAGGSGNSSFVLRHFLPAPVTTTQIGIGARTISAGSDGTIAVATVANQVVIGDAVTTGTAGNRMLQVGVWTPMTGNAIDIAVVGKEQYYMITPDRQLFIWRDNKWNYLFYDAKAVSASWDGTVAMVSQSSGMIWYKTGYNVNPNWGMTGGVTGAIDVAVVGGGVMYFIGAQGAISRTTSYNSKGVVVGNNGSKISVSKDGTVVAVFADGTVWRKLADDNSDTWTQIKGLENMVDVAVQDSNTIFVTNGASSVLRID